MDSSQKEVRHCFELKVPADGMKDRPHTICHMLASIDGKIDGTFMRSPACADALAAYGAIREQYECTGAIYGTITMERTYCSGLAPKGLQGEQLLPKQDWIPDASASHWIVSLDPGGILGFDSNCIEKKGRPKARVLEALTASASDGYLEYLRRLEIPYIFAGETEIDCKELLIKLKALLGMQRVMISGGGYTDWAFLNAGCLDELSLVIAPLADGSTTSVSIFERSAASADTPAFPFTLKETRQLEGNTLWLRYVPMPNE